MPRLGNLSTSLAAAALAAGLAACGPGQSNPADDGTASAPSGPSVQVQPVIAMVQTSASLGFEARPSAAAADATVEWSVQPAGCGSITSAGVFTAPASPATCRVVATLPDYGVASTPATVNVSSTALCANEPLRGTGRTYYYCNCTGPGADPQCRNGDDAADGLGPDRPRRGLSPTLRSRFNALAAGDTIALCRGGSWPSSWGDASRVLNTACTSGAGTCDLRDYTPDAHPDWASDQTKRPIISGAGNAYGIFFSYQSPDTAQGHFRLFNVQMIGGTFPIGLGSLTHDVDICNVRVSGHLQAGVVVWQDTPRVTIRQSQFDGAVGGQGHCQGFLYGCTDCVLEDNHFANDSYGTDGYYDHPIYLGCVAGSTCRRMVVRNNQIHGCRPAGGSPTGTALVVAHANLEDLLIENNLVQCDHENVVNGSQFGIGIGPGYGTGEGFARTVIRRNWIVGNAAGITMDAAPDGVIEDNVIIMRATAANWGAIEVGNNGTDTGGDLHGSRYTVRNNTAYYPGSSVAAAFRAAAVGAGLWGGTGHVFANNVAYYAQPSGSCLGLAGAASDYQLVANNACNVSAGTAFGSGFVRLTSSPFVAVGTDFTPAAGSPLVDGGTSAATCTVGGVASSPCYSPTARGAGTWSPDDVGAVRAGPSFDIGAAER